MPSRSAEILKKELRLAKPIVELAGIQGARIAQDSLGRLGVRALAEQVTFHEVEFPRFSACFITPNDCVSPDSQVILYLHGGGYTAGSLDYARGFCSVIADASGINVFCAAYRLAPEHPFPAALDDAAAAYDYLLRRGYSHSQIAFVGESAGGGLIYCLALRLREMEIDLPCAFVAMSPWVDLTLSGASYENNKDLDPTLSHDSLLNYTEMYAAGQETDPLVSPVFGDLSFFPPSLIIAGSDEILLSDAQMMTSRLTAGGSRCRLVISPGMWHVYPLYRTEEAQEAISDMSDFLNEHLHIGDK